MSYSRGRQINDGGEGYIFEVNENPNLLMKIFKQEDPSGEPILTPELITKLTYMLNNPPVKLVEERVIAWPIEFVYENHYITGFIMPKLDMHEHVQRVYSYRHPILDSSEYATFPSVKSRISIAINLCAALHELHRMGYVAGDFNHRNIGVNYSTGQIYVVDCDSFHITDNSGVVHRTNVIMAGYLAPEIIEHCNKERIRGNEFNLDKVSLPTFTKESDLFCLAVHIFKLLMNGVDPFRGIKSDATGSTASPFVGNDAIERDAYVFRVGNKPAAVFCPPAQSLPPDILSLFNKAFIEGRSEPLLRPSAGDWYRALNSYLMNYLAQCPYDAKHHFYNQLHTCPYCEADNLHFSAQGGTIPTPLHHPAQHPPPVPTPPPPAPMPHLPAKRSKSAIWAAILAIAAVLVVVIVILLSMDDQTPLPLPSPPDPSGSSTQSGLSDPTVSSDSPTPTQPEPTDPSPMPYSRRVDYADGSYSIFEYNEYDILTWESKYDRNDNIAIEVSYNASGNVIYEYQYMYDDNGINNMIIVFDADRNIPWWIELRYDASGNLSEEIWHDPAYDRVISWGEYNLDGSYIWEDYEYDTVGNRIGMIRYIFNSDGSSAGWEELEFDILGNITKIAVYNADGSLNYQGP